MARPVLELFTTEPAFEVQPSEYHRLLGFPPDHEAAGRVPELVAWARRWYRDHGKPWWYARLIDNVALVDGVVTIAGSRFASPGLHDPMYRAEADAAIVVAVSAGPECEERARRAWDAEQPDEYFFLEVFGSAVVEALVAAAAYQLCAWADEHDHAVLPHYSPGYPRWDIADQQRLLNVVAAGTGYASRDRLHVLETGMLQPKKSLLAVFGLTRHVDRVRRLTALVPCECCSLAGCRFRRAPYGHPPPRLDGLGAGPPHHAGPALTRGAAYTLGAATLEKWARQRLTLRTEPDRTITARFRYEGTTCSNLGAPLAFDYHVRVSAAESGYTVLDARCEPAPGDTGHTSMCEYLVQSDALLAVIAGERPLLGRPLNDVLQWSREPSPAGCYCEAGARAHKWGLVLEVLHYALAQSIQPGGT